MNPREALTTAFRAAIQAGHPTRVLRDVPLPEVEGRTVIISIGKAALSMASTVQQRLGGRATGVVVARQEELPAHVENLTVLGSTHPPRVKRVPARGNWSCKPCRASHQAISSCASFPAVPPRSCPPRRASL